MAFRGRVLSPVVAIFFAHWLLAMRIVHWMDEGIDGFLSAIESEVGERASPQPLAEHLASGYGLELSGALRRWLDAIGRFRVEDVNPEPDWKLFQPDDFVIPTSFEGAVARARDFTGGFGFLQIAMPMVPVVKLERRDNLFVVLTGGHPIVLLPQESLFDICASELYFVGSSLDTVASQLSSGGAKGVEIEYAWDHPVQDRHLAIVPFGYLLTRTSPDPDDDEGLDVDTLVELLELGDHPAELEAGSVADAFYRLAYAYFLEPDRCAGVANENRNHQAPIVADMARTFAELAEGRESLAGVPVARLREAIRDAGVP